MNIDPAERIWEYDGVGNRVYKNQPTRVFNGVNIERMLIKLAEECGELTQRCMKIVGQGCNEQSVKDIADEMADVKCCIDILISEGFVNREYIKDRAAKKVVVFTEYDMINIDKDTERS